MKAISHFLIVLAQIKLQKQKLKEEAKDAHTEALDEAETESPIELSDIEDKNVEDLDEDTIETAEADKEADDTEFSNAEVVDSSEQHADPEKRNEQALDDSSEST